jgi:hypothetical protein
VKWVLAAICVLLASALWLTDGSRAADNDMEILAKCVYGEAGGMLPEEQRLVVWTVFQRVDDGRFGASIKAVITAPAQFTGYAPDKPVVGAILALCEEEYAKWKSGAEPPLCPPYAKSAPYLYFLGYDGHNWYRAEYRDSTELAPATSVSPPPPLAAVCGVCGIGIEQGEPYWQADADALCVECGDSAEALRERHGYTKEVGK